MRWARASLATGFLVLALCVAVPGSETALAALPATAPMVEAALNDMDLGGCGGASAGGTFGTVWVTRMPDNRVSVRVQVRNAEPNATYQINISCSGAIGTLETNGRGRGTAMVLPTDAWHLYERTSFAIDMHIAGPPYADPARSTPISLPLAG